MSRWPTMSTFAHFQAGIQRMTLARSGDPDLATLAKALRGAVGPLQDMLEFGEGKLTIRSDNGRLMLEAETPNHRLCERVE